MPTETELKLSLAPAHVHKFLQHPLLQHYPVTTKQLRNTYFDTVKLELLQRKIGLRIRYLEQRRIQTLKTAGHSVGGLHQRQEWETEIAQDTPDLSKIPSFLAIRLLNPLLPVFTTDFKRMQWDIPQGDSLIELVLDQGTIATPHATMPLCEIELELKTGNPTALYELALNLLEHLPLQLENRSKAARGYQLFQPKNHEATKAEPIVLQKNITARAAFEQIMWNELRHLQLNELAVLNPQHQVEAIHQMRVAVRRLRSCLGVFKSLIAPSEEYTELRNELQWLGNVLGIARDWDVFAETLDAVQAQVSDVAILSLQNSVRYLQTQASQHACETLHAPRYHRLLLRLGKWLLQQKVGESALDVEVKTVATEILQRRYEVVQARGKKLSTLNDTQRHKMRIEIKKLNYATRFFGSLYASDKVYLHLNYLSELQTELGVLNDIHVAQRLLDQVGLPPRAPVRLILKGWYAGQRENYLKKLEKTWTTWSTQKNFW